MNRQQRWNKLVAAIEEDVPGFSVRFKNTSAFHRLLGYISVWSWSTDPETGERIYGYMNMTTTMGSQIWFSSEDHINESLPADTLEHEWVHMKDAQSFFALLPLLPASVNRMLFSLSYILFFPWPGCIRAYAELRAYRRSLELVGEDKRAAYLEHYIKQFTGGTYFFMWPFPKQVERLLQKPSPYKELMDRTQD